METLEEYWLLILLAAAIAALIGWYVFHAARRTRVTGERRDVLDEGSARAARNQALIDAPTEAPIPPTTPTGLAGAGEVVGIPVEHQQIAEVEQDNANDLARLKGVGPKLISQLNSLGVISLAQVASWSDEDIDRIDAQLGRFRGRIRRDQWVDQARLLTAGDEAGYAARFGNIS